MKTMILFFSFLMFSFSVYCQSGLTLKQTLLVKSQDLGVREKFELIYYETPSMDDRQLELLSCTHSDLNGSEYMVDWRKTMNYDEKKRKTGWINEIYSNGTWYNYRKNIFVYNDKDQIIEWINEKYSYNGWIHNFHVLYQFDDDGNIVSARTEQWKNDEYALSSMDTSVFELIAPFSLIEETSTLQWNGLEWINKSRRIKQYESGLLTEDTYEIWYQDEWASNWKKEYVYNQDREKELEIWKLYSDGEFVNYYRKTFSYDTHGNMVEVLNEKWESDKWSEADGDLDFIDCKGNFFQHLKNGCLITISWADITSVEEKKKNIQNVSIHPNPFSQFSIFNFQFSKAGHVSLKVIDMLGNEVATLVDGFKEAGRHEARFDGSGLAPGMYFYVLRAGERVESGKVVKIE